MKDLEQSTSLSERNPKAEMTATDVLDFYTALDKVGIKIWIDGGWGVDALLEEQSRPHGDLDIAIQEKDVPEARRILEAQGYKDVPRDDTSPWNFVLGDDKGHLIDFHVINFDEEGRGVLGPVENNAFYPAGALTGTGAINGVSVRCIAPEHMVKFHTGYKLRESDYKDVSALCKKFGIEYPKEYTHLKKSN